MQSKNDLQRKNFKPSANAHKNSSIKNQLSHFINQWSKYNSMEECTWACLNGKRDKTQVIIQWSQMLVMTAPLMLCAAQKTSLLPRKGLQETPPPVLRKWWKFSHKLLGQNPQKPKNSLARFGLPKINPQRSPAILHCLMQRYSLKPHLRCSENYETLWDPCQKPRKDFGWFRLLKFDPLGAQPQLQLQTQPVGNYL